jgi:hypothetical protein
MSMMQSEKIDKIYQLETNIKSDKFDVEDMSYYQLCISISSEHFRFCAINALDHQCLLLQDYRFFSRFNTDELLNTLNRIFDNDMFLKANFWKSVNIIQKGQPFTFVPNSLFEESAPDRYLKLIAPASEKDTLITVKQENMNAVNISYIDKKIQKWFKQTYPTRELNFVHQTTAFLEGIHKQFPRLSGANVHLFIENNYFILAILREGELEFCNVFSYRDANDFIYYVLFVFDEFRLSKDGTSLLVYGNINPVSAVYQKLQTYFGAIELVTDNPNWITFEYLFNEISNYHYFDLYSLYLNSESL